jgi:hypothetical protein
LFPPNTDLWLALERSPFARAQGRQSRIFQVIARLADNVTVAQAQSELSTIVAKLAKDYPNTNKDVVPLVQLYNERILGAQFKLVFYALLGAVAFVLLVACANVANLQLARAADRAKEISIRISLGASRWRIVRQLLVESVLLALFGGLLGIPLSILGVRFFDAATQDVGKPYWMTFNLDPRVRVLPRLLQTGVGFGVAPAMHVEDQRERSDEGGRPLFVGACAPPLGSAPLVGSGVHGRALAGAGFTRADISWISASTSRLPSQLTLNDRKAPRSR